MDRVRTVTWADPQVGIQAHRTMSGLQYLTAIKEGTYPGSPLFALLGMQFDHVEEGRIRLKLKPGEHLFNLMGTVHGGVTGTLCDTAMGCAIHSTLPAGKGSTTLEYKVNFVRPITLGLPQVFCEGEVLHRGARTATAEARVFDSNGKLYAHASTTCLIFDHSVAE